MPLHNKIFLVTIMSDIKKVIIEIDKLPIKTQGALRQVINATSFILASDIRTKFLTGGTTDNKLRARSGVLRRGTKPITVKIVDNNIIGGVSFDRRYIKTHFGKKGEYETIVPKNKKFLTIPLEAAMTAAGVLKGKATDESVFGDTVIIKTKKQGNVFAVIYGKQRGIKGDLKSKLLPLFLLARKVRVPKRVHSDVILRHAKNLFRESVIKIYRKSLKNGR